MYILHNSHDHLENFSPQQVASCVAECDGCGGGDTVTAYEYLKTTKLAQGPFWPYAQGLTPLDSCTGKSCTEACSSHNVDELEKYKFYIGPYAQVTGFSYATPTCTDECADQDLGKLAASVAEGPVSICVNAGAWSDYTGGVLTSAGCGGFGFDDLDHCVQLVGYNTTAETPYWIVRNSWDTGFGEAGYIYLEYSKNTCGLADEATIALLEAPAEPQTHFGDMFLQAAGEPYAVEDSCTGSADPVVSGPVCYKGAKSVFGIKEDIEVTISDYKAPGGHLDLTGSGALGITCKNHAFTKSGQEITVDLSDCLTAATVKSVKYCSDTDTIAVTVADNAVPLPIKATLAKVACASEGVVV